MVAGHPQEELVAFDLTGGEVADERAVDLDHVEGDLLQVGEGAEAGAVVVDRDFAAELGEPVGEASGDVVVLDPRRLGDLEGAAARIGFAFVEAAFV